MRNVILHGDCLELMHDIPDGSVDLIVTDPPYLIQYKSNYRKDKTHDFCSEIKGASDPQLITDYIKQCHRILKNDSAMYMFCSFDRVDFFKQQLEKYFKVKNMIIWVKNNRTAGDLEAQFGKQYEIIFLANKGRKKFNGKRLSDVWAFNRKAGKEQLHQNEKPVALIERCIEKHSVEGDIVFDGFGGSGTTAEAAINLKRNYIVMEKEQKYIDVINKRIENVTAQGRLF